MPSRTLKKTPSLISVLGPANINSLAGDMMVDGVFPPLMKVAKLLLWRPLVLSGLANEGAPSWQQEILGSRPQPIIDERSLFGACYSCGAPKLLLLYAARSSEGGFRASSPSSLMVWWALRISLRAMAKHARLGPSRSEDST